MSSENKWMVFGVSYSSYQCHVDETVIVMELNEKNLSTMRTVTELAAKIEGQNSEGFYQLEWYIDAYSESAYRLLDEDLADSLLLKFTDRYKNFCVLPGSEIAEDILVDSHTVTMGCYPPSMHIRVESDDDWIETISFLLEDIEKALAGEYDYIKK